VEAKEGSKQGSCASKSCLCYAATLCLGLITSIPIMKGRSTSGITTVPSACTLGEGGKERRARSGAAGTATGLTASERGRGSQRGQASGMPRARDEQQPARLVHEACP
jgi:hypothetical protein